MIELFQFGFMQRAFAAATITGIVCSVIGVYVVLRGMAFMGAGIAHASFGGVALGFTLGMEPFFTTIVFCILTALGIGLISEKRQVREDTAVGIFFASTMAMGVLLIGFIKGYTIDLFGYIFGNILAVTTFDVWSGFILAVIVLLVVMFFYKEYLFITFDEEMARVTGLPVRTLNFVLLVMMALTVVLSIKIVGIVLVSALIVIPPASAYQLTHNFRTMMILSVIFGVISSWTGLVFSAFFDLPSGATIVLTGTALFFITFIFSPKRRMLMQRVNKLGKLGSK